MNQVNHIRIVAEKPMSVASNAVDDVKLKPGDVGFSPLPMLKQRLKYHGIEGDVFPSPESKWSDRSLNDVVVTIKVRSFSQSQLVRYFNDVEAIFKRSTYFHTRLPKYQNAQTKKSLGFAKKGRYVETKVFPINRIIFNIVQD